MQFVNFVLFDFLAHSIYFCATNMVKLSTNMKQAFQFCPIQNCPYNKTAWIVPPFQGMPVQGMTNNE